MNSLTTQSLCERFGSLICSIGHKHDAYAVAYQMPGGQLTHFPCAQYKNRRYQVRSVLDVEHVTVSRSETGLPRISVELRNKSGKAIPLEVRTSWYDASGRPIDAATSWTRVFAQPMAMALYEQVSIKPDAAHYYVEVRGAE